MRYAFLPQVEMSWLKWPDFFPNREQALKQRDWICIGTKSRNLGDALVLTPLAHALKTKYPHIKVFSFARAFNPVVLSSNPYVERVCYFPDQVFGDDCNWENGHLIQQKEKFFDVAVSSQPKPSLFLTSEEEKWAKKFLARKGIPLGGKKLCVIHCSGVTWKNLLPAQFWQKLVEQWSPYFTFIQVGMKGGSPLEGALECFLDPRVWDARKLFAVMKQASVFCGIDSGPMHVARAFSLPSLVLIKGEDPERIFEQRRQIPYFLGRSWKFANLYEENFHVRVDAQETDLISRVNGFFEAMTKL